METQPQVLRARAAPLIRLIQGTMQRMTGRRYDIDFDGLDVKSLNELQRFLNDADLEAQIRARHAQLNPWKRP